MDYFNVKYMCTSDRCVRARELGGRSIHSDRMGMD